MAQAWEMNSYMQYFYGYSNFEHKFPCDPSDFVYFRKRLGKEGIEKIFIHTVELHGEKVSNYFRILQYQRITSLTQRTQNWQRIIDKCNKIAEEESITQRQTYKRVSKQPLRDSYNSQYPKRRKKARKSLKKLKIITSRLVREFERKLPEERIKLHQSDLELFT